MSKITFRADDDLIARLEEFDASKSEVMRDALREYLDEHAAASPSTPPTDDAASDSLDELVTERVDAIIADRLDGAFTPAQPQDINVNITLDGDGTATADTDETASHEPSSAPSHGDADRKTPERTADDDADEVSNTCSQCGETLSQSHVYCPNCGEKASHRVFCECGDEIRSDWGFCPSCGRRTPAADVLDQS
ncbi:ribbon-helix-helix protein, CopG family [Halapricum sp. CBA1109]|uniref:double zinc ribbon domain-containing protein n=1 Tax=Halapricum sp. CBA1109 TaxID=2668068 RepID=UPI0012F90FE6|nr:zinc ribbon domain-containing protein [Halapricum sp. CBA1109]MUV90311.1 ribbon-helix-helix protein, CopG family [Halapricum sp. CBA1109]